MQILKLMEVLEKRRPTRGVFGVMYVGRVIKMDLVLDSTLIHYTQDKNHISVLIVINGSDYLDLESFT